MADALLLLLLLLRPPLPASHLCFSLPFLSLSSLPSRGSGTDTNCRFQCNSTSPAIYLFDEMRDPKVCLPSGQPLPPLFDFSEAVFKCWELIDGFSSSIELKGQIQTVGSNATQ
ncbi:unnamed protein product [Miscanthus lutarioriparius]|uniref:Secreted protein n=1 Tax=Miscanthus lutarioriparius TaxID=422564 RepID=A0A811RV56_9POAL|nr:unnamed protein product [Miscanthus lutarioriparius]